LSNSASPFFVLVANFFLWYWGLNSPLHQQFFLGGFFKIGSHKLLS
jgi:hypothetical protein